MSRKEIIDKFKELIEKNGRNGILDVTDAGTAVVSIEYEKSVNDIIFNFDEENDDFCVSGDYTTKELYNMCVKFAVNY
nr:MAG TPA: hypothetical protein [Bacteriophage sp.]